MGFIMNKINILRSFLESIEKNDKELVNEISNAVDILFEADSGLSSYNKKADSLYGQNPDDAFKYYKRAQAHANPKSRDFIYATGGITRILADRGKKNEALTELKKIPSTNQYRIELEKELGKSSPIKPKPVPIEKKKEISKISSVPTTEEKPIQTKQSNFIDFIKSLPDDDVFKRTMLSIEPSTDISFYDGIIPENSYGEDALIVMMASLDDDSRKKQFATAFRKGNKENANIIIKKMPDRNASQFIKALGSDKKTVIDVTGKDPNESFGFSEAMIKILWASILRSQAEIWDKKVTVAFQYMFARYDFIKLAESKGRTEDQYFRATLGMGNKEWLKSPEEAMEIYQSTMSNSNISKNIQNIKTIQKDMLEAVRSGIDLDKGLIFNKLREKKDDILSLIADMFGAGGVVFDDNVEQLFGIRKNGMIYLSGGSERRKPGGFLEFKRGYFATEAEGSDVSVFPGTSLKEIPNSIHIGGKVTMDELISQGIRTRLYYIEEAVPDLGKHWYPRVGE